MSSPKLNARDAFNQWYSAGGFRLSSPAEELKAAFVAGFAMATRVPTFEDPALSSTLNVDCKPNLQKEGYKTE